MKQQQQYLFELFVNYLNFWNLGISHVWSFIQYFEFVKSKCLEFPHTDRPVAVALIQWHRSRFRIRARPPSTRITRDIIATRGIKPILTYYTCVGKYRSVLPVSWYTETLIYYRRPKLRCVLVLCARLACVDPPPRVKAIITSGTQFRTNAAAMSLHALAIFIIFWIWKWKFIVWTSNWMYWIFRAVVIRWTQLASSWFIFKICFISVRARLAWYTVGGIPEESKITHTIQDVVCPRKIQGRRMWRTLQTLQTSPVRHKCVNVTFRAISLRQRAPWRTNGT